MYHFRTQFACLFLVCYLTPVMADDVSPAEQLFEAYVLKQPMPVLEPSPSLQEALHIQHQYGVLRNPVDKILGFELTATHPEVADAWGLHTPFTISVFQSEMQSATSLRAPSPQGFLEAKLGYYLGAPITEPIEDVADLKGLIQSVVPLVIYSELNFEGPEVSSGDIVAGNGGQHQRWLGAVVEAEPFDFDALEVIIRFEDIPLSAGRGQDSLGSQWESLQTLINQSLAMGWTLPANTLLITGGLASPFPPTLGTYQIEFGPLGSLMLSVN
jgi:2-keto-4-pentenoate hydratase